MDSPAQLRPKLPRELERLIFEWAAWGDYKTTLKLLVVARRVHFWIEKFLHRVLVLEHTSYAAPPTRTPSLENSKYAQWLECVACIAREDLCQLKTILASCKNITDLALWGGCNLGHPLAVLQPLENLRRLSVDGAVFEDVLSPADLAALQRLTHLQIFGLCPPELVGTLRRLPRVRYLSLLLCQGFSTGFVGRVLEASRLKLLVYLQPGGQTRALEDVEARIADHRFVVITGHDFREDWIVGAWGGRDYWVLAEEIVQARIRSGE
ncbi:hypothetical protein HMN09_00844200 [Mycena chlorophos]|uniref:Uncharacterized protein n=1 Tax=Mycena chlorophos TaxID=658473 RepID=A0A8H6STH1_MYCCL|nr:hypothetical protein HMN09_00844200 [Mycena chlorophos]